jgi:DNA-directed RNA polymerase sigma subunit (sigma70/sigma32)
VANEGERTLEEVAAVLGVSDERVRQVEERALHKLRSIRTLKRMHRESE